MVVMHKMINLIVLVLFVLLSACTGSKTAQNGPQKTLTEYVEKSFAVKAINDKKDLLNLTTGEVKKLLEGIDEKSFLDQFLHSKRSFVALRVKDERKMNDTKYTITYELVFNEQSNDSKNPNKSQVTSKKYALFELESGVWKISEVRNLKTLIEHQNEMTF